MSEAVCFNCGIRLGNGKSMEELLSDRLPVFCCVKCSIEFPDNGTSEFEERLNKLKKEVTGNSSQS